MLNDSARSRALLVAVAEETPIRELVETAYAVEDEVGLALGPVVVNSVLEEIESLDQSAERAQFDAAASGEHLPPGRLEDLAAAANFRRDRMALQVDQLDSLARQLPLAQIRLPHLFTTSIGLAELTGLADAAAGCIAEFPESGD